MVALSSLAACNGEHSERSEPPEQRPVGSSPPSTAALSGSALSARAPVPPPAPPAMRLFAAFQRTCAISSEGRLTCWGEAIPGPRPPSDEPVFDRYPLRAVTSVALGDAHACAVSESKVACWGWNAGAELGPKSNEACPNGPMSVECATKPRFIEGLPPIRSVAVGHVHGCAIGVDQSLWCWGTSRRGSLGFSPADRCEAGPCARTPRRIEGLGPVAQVALGSAFTCALESNGTVSCWGASPLGELGTGVTDAEPHERPARIAKLDRVVAIAAGSSHACALRDDGRVHCWGSNAAGQLGVGTTARCGGAGEACAPEPVVVSALPPVTALALSNTSSCAIANRPGAGPPQGALYCWGADTDRWLGVGSTTTCRAGGLDVPCVTAPTLLAHLPPFASIANGGDHACGVAPGGAVLCWGAWSEGQLGFRAPHCRRDGPVGCVEPPSTPTGLF